MPRMIQVLALLGVMTPALLVTSCQTTNQALVASYSQRLSPLLNTGTKDDVARQFGVPTGKQAVGTHEIWEYMKETGGVADVGPGPRRMGGGPIYGHKTFEKLTLEFDDKSILRSWRLETESGLLVSEPPPAGSAPKGGGTSSY